MEKIIKLELRNSITNEKCFIDCYSREHAKQIIRDQIEVQNNDWRVVVNNDEVESIVNELREEFNQKVVNDNKNLIAPKITLNEFLSFMDSDDYIKVWYQHVLVFHCRLSSLYTILTPLSSKFLDCYVNSFGSCYCEEKGYSYININLI